MFLSSILIICLPIHHSTSVSVPSIGEHVWLAEDMVNDTIRIPTWWHDFIRGVGQQFNSVKEMRLALIYYAIDKKFIYKFVKNDKKDHCGMLKEGRHWLRLEAPRIVDHTQHQICY